MWIIKNDMSHQIVSCNIHFEDDKYQLWITRSNGKNLKLSESDNKDEITTIKDAIDYAIKNNIPALEL